MGKVDVDRIPVIARQYRVTAIPTVLIMQTGTIVKRLAGLRRESEYTELLDKFID